ncbi:MAG: TonB family protein [Acidobacteria bacterium]|nr:TonB family protein [Acidobacteriota bacterium]
MEPRAECEECGRSIDPLTRACPYCNAVRSPTEVLGERRPDTVVANVRPPRPDYRRKPQRAEAPRKIFMAALALVVLAAIFMGGFFVRSLGKKPPPDASPFEGPEVGAIPKVDIALVSDPSAAQIGRSYTSRAPVEIDTETPEEFQRRDATALPEAVYRDVAAVEDRRSSAADSSVDPRTVTEAVRPRPRRPDPPEPTGPAPTPAVSSVPPQPLSQPIPTLRSRESGSVRLQLTISPSGRVTDVRVIESLEGVTERLVAAARNWTFRPAMLNDVPVEGTYRVEIKVNPE